MVRPFLQGGTLFVQVVVGIVHANHVLANVIQDSFRDVLIDAELREPGAGGAAQVVGSEDCDTVDLESPFAAGDRSSDVFRIRGRRAADIWQHISGISRHDLQFLQLVDRLVRQGHHMTLAALGVTVRDRPGLRFEVKFPPLRESEFATALQGQEQQS